MTDHLNGESFTESGFITEFDGSQPEISAEEQGQAATYFQDGLESTLAEYADFTEGNLFTYLRLKTFFEDKTSLTFVITSTFIAPAVRLLVNDSHGDPRKTFDYSLSQEGDCVRRVDVGDETKRKDEGAPGTVRYVGELPAYPLSDAAENTRLEDQLGMNNQPVGLHEITALFTLVGQASVDS